MYCYTKSQSNWKLKFHYPRVSPGDQPLTKSWRNSGLEIVRLAEANPKQTNLAVRDWGRLRIFPGGDSVAILQCGKTTVRIHTQFNETQYLFQGFTHHNHCQHRPTSYLRFRTPLECHELDSELVWSFYFNDGWDKGSSAGPLVPLELLVRVGANSKGWFSTDNP